MSDLVVYCQPRSKEKDRFGKHTQTLTVNSKMFEYDRKNRVTKNVSMVEMFPKHTVCLVLVLEPLQSQIAKLVLYCCSTISDKSFYSLIIIITI